MAVFFGIFPQTLFNYMDKTINRQTETLAEWTKDVKEAPGAVPAVPASAAQHTPDEPSRVSLLER